jgi:signal transduction histidine kinase
VETAAKDRELFAEAHRLVGRDGLEGFSMQELATTSGVALSELTDRFPSNAALFRDIVIDFLMTPVEQTRAAVERAPNGEVALDEFVRITVRHNLANLDGYRVHSLCAHARFMEAFRWFADNDHNRLISANQAMFGPVAAKLAADWGEELPNGIHPRRLVFVSFLAITGLTWFQAMLDASGNTGAHNEEDLIDEMSRALVSPTRVMRQLGALNDVAAALASIRDEETLLARVPKLLCERLDFDRASVFLVKGDALVLASVGCRGEAAERSAELLARSRELNLPPLPAHQRCFGEARSLYVAAPEIDADWPTLANADAAELLRAVHPPTPMLATPIRDRGDVVGVLAGHLDVRHGTIDKRDASRLETFATLVGLALENARFYATLQAKVDERTRELRDAQARVVQSEKMASQAQLVAALVHELNTPMGAVASSVQTVEQARTRLLELGGEAPSPTDSKKFERLQEMQRRAANAALQGVERVQAVLDRLRAFVRLDGADRQRVPISELLEDVLEMAEHQRPETVRVEREHAEAPAVECDPRRLNQAFSNLVTNGFEAMPNGGVLSVRSWHADGCVLVSIGDTGEGIDTQTRARLFEPGFSTKQGRVAAGLGLATCHQILADHGATIEVESRPGQGATFTIVLAVDLPRPDSPPS